MLFDLRGRRRRAVQATYLTLAVLMGGGLVLVGVGSNVNGGLLDVFKGTGDDSGSDVAPAVRKRIERNEKRLKASPADTAILAELVRDEYQVATAQIESGATGFPKDARDELRKVDVYWTRYLAVEKAKPSPDLARYALQVYDPAGLNKPKAAQKAASIIAQDGNDTNSYLNLVQYAALAGDKRTADLAAVKAVDLAPKNQRKAVKAQADQLKKPQTSQPQG
jgi:hypothetical protein